MKPEINKVLTISTAHMTEEDGRKLDNAKAYYLSADRTEYGWFVCVAPEVVGEAKIRKFSDGFIQSVRLAQDNDCRYLLFDRDGDKIDGLRQYNW